MLRVSGKATARSGKHPGSIILGRGAVVAIPRSSTDIASGAEDAEALQAAIRLRAKVTRSGVARRMNEQLSQREMSAARFTTATQMIAGV